jgi:hypothetical protein
MSGEPSQTKPSLWRTIKAVSWAFLGIRKGSEYRQDLTELKPVHIIVVGIASALVFVLVLVGIVNWVVVG